MIKFPNTDGVGIDCLSYVSGSRFNAKNFTVAAYVKRLGAGTTISCGTNGLTAVEPIFTHGVGESDTIGLNLGWLLGYVPAVNRFAVDFEDTNNGLNHPFTFSNVISPTTGNFHVVITYVTGYNSSGYYSGYVNGVLNLTSGFTNATPNVRIPDYGSRQGVGIGIAINSSSGRAGAWNGYIWDCALWDDALTSEEVAQLYSGGMAYMPLQIRPQNLQAYYPLDEIPDGGTVSTTARFITDRVTNSGATMFGPATGYANDIQSY